MSKLTSFMTKKLEAWVDVPGFPGFQVKLAYLTREELNKIRSDCTQMTYSPKNRTTTNEFDADKFIKSFVASSVTDWRGFTVDIAKQLLPVVVGDAVDPKEIIEYSVDDAVILTRQSPFFDDWLNEAVFDLQTFRGGEQGRNPEPVGEVS